MDDNRLHEYCDNLQIALTYSGKSDIDADYLFSELQPGLLSLADLCRRTDYPALCLDAAKAYGHAYPSPPDAAALLSMHLDMAADHTRTVKAEAEELLSKGKGSPREKGAIDVCNTQFGDAIDDTDTVREAVKGRDAGTANTVLSAIITYYDTCDDAFAEIPLPNPFAKQDDSLSKIISNALALVPIVIS
ncbi:pectinesterase 3-like [Zingiber officinale]|uniref:pectinesterase 3-like n=1 Tax=Zingiber officinale TaxID=94328 RepID=UPI001C4BF2B7|nr:pectinesterase 3-like [Zingiber officinale]